MLSLEDLLIAALDATTSWAERADLLRGIGCDEGEIEAVRLALEQCDEEAVIRIVRGPDVD